MTALLEVDDLRTHFFTEGGVVRAVEGLSYRIDRGEKFGIVGESGAGKSVASLSLMGLIDDPGRVVGGSIRFCDEATAAEFETAFPDRVVDVEALRAEHDLVELVGRSLESGVSPSEIVGDDRIDAGADARTVVRDGDVGMRDVVDSGLGVELGVVDGRACVVRDGDERYVEVTRADGEPLRRLRGDHLAMVFQNPKTALNPVHTVGEQIAEAIRTHMDLAEDAVRARAVDLLDRVGIPDPDERYGSYPHEFSGGMLQRAVIAIALSCDPDLVIADEPTTALDVTIEAGILELLDEVSAETDTAVQLISHDLGVVAGVCDRLAVLYAGKPVETGTVEDLYYDPKHPYTAGLMASIPRIGDDRDRLDTIPGTMPDLVAVPPGCPFHPRCPYAEQVCTELEPALVDADTGESIERDDRDAHGAACLEYTGDLDEGLDFEVVVEDGNQTGSDANTTNADANAGEEDA